MGRAVENRFGRALFHHLTTVQHQDLVTQTRNYTQVVRDHDDGGAEVALQFAHQGQDLGLHGHVQCRGGLVGNQHIGLAQQGHGDHDALAHAARKLVRIHTDAASRFGHLHGIERLDGAHACVLAREALVQFQHLGHLALHREVRVERGHRILKDHGDAVAANAVEFGRRHAQHVLPLKAHLPRGLPVAGEQSHDGQHGLALARAALAHNAQSLASIQIEVNAVDRADDAVRCLELHP